MQHQIDRDADTRLDRRRPGRPATVSAKLLPLLRAEERAHLPPLPESCAPDRGLDTGPGVLLGVGLGALLWAAGISAAWSLLR